MRKILCILALILVSNVYLWAGERVVFTPQWTPQSQFAGYYAALHNGFYAEAGLDVEIKHPTNSMYALDMLENGTSNIITSMLIDAIVCSDKGYDMVNIMQLMPRSMMMIISHEALNHDATKLNGKRIATWKAGFSTVVIALFKELGIDIEWVKFLSGVNIFLSGSVDASTVMYYNELQTIQETGYNVKDTHILKLWDLGYNLPEDGLYTSSEFAKKNPEAVAKFAEASIKGWQWVANNVDKAVDIVLIEAQNNNIPTNRYHQTKMLKAILESRVEVDKDDYNLNKDDFVQTRDLLLRAGLIKKPISFEDFNEVKK